MVYVVFGPTAYSKISENKFDDVCMMLSLNHYESHALSYLSVEGRRYCITVTSMNPSGLRLHGRAHIEILTPMYRTGNRAVRRSIWSGGAGRLKGVCSR